MLIRFYVVLFEMIAVSVFLSALWTRLMCGFWPHEGPVYRRLLARYTAALKAIAATALTPDDHSAMATEAQFLRSLARNALDPARLMAADLQTIDANVPLAMRLHRASGYGEPLERDERPPPEAN